MELERKDGITEKDIHHNPTGIVKEYKEEHEKLANRLVDIAHELKGSIRTQMNNDYFQKVTELEEMNVSEDYIIGWQEGYQHAPKIEEQRLSDAYEAGYEDGENQTIEKAANFKKQLFS